MRPPVETNGLPLPVLEVSRWLQRATGFGATSRWLALHPAHRSRLAKADIEAIDAAHRCLFGVPLPRLHPYRPDPKDRPVPRHPEYMGQEVA